MAQRTYFTHRSKAETKMLDLRPVDEMLKAGEDEVADVDEPPEHICFERRKCPTSCRTDGQSQAQAHASQSLLTKALLTSPNLRGVSTINTSMAPAKPAPSTTSAISGASTADLTSDGGMTSPARTSTPSPPFPPTRTGLPILQRKGTDELEYLQSSSLRLPAVEPTKRPEPMKRHITFACARPKEEEKKTEEPKTEEEPPKRKCMLRFACPSKPEREEPTVSQPPKLRRVNTPPMNVDTTSSNKASTGISMAKSLSSSPVNEKDTRSGSVPSSPEVTRTEGLCFQSAPKPEDEHWIHEKPSNRSKITVSDTLRKENAIRKIGQEAEDEAQEEEDEDDVDLEDDDDLDVEEDEDDEDDEDDGEDDVYEDDGNITDDEEGFAASDDESEADSEYQFWTPAVTTAATSTDHLEHIRPRHYRSASGSSLESMSAKAVPTTDASHPPRYRGKRRSTPKMRPGTPELPDSTDFVCGTLDEDRPLELAYMSCMEQRRIAKQVPQDVDPSFPTSDIDDEEDEDDDEDYDVADGSDSHLWVAGKPDESDDALKMPQRSRASSTRKTMAKSPAPSPKRMKSPAPLKRRTTKSPAPAVKGTHAARSPPPRRLFGHSPHPTRAAPSRNLTSPRVSRENSFNGTTHAIGFAALAQRPQLTHTKSLPRTPNPFWTAHRRSRLDKFEGEGNEDLSTAAESEVHSRGPIDIVQGLEHKRQRRKEKFWKQHCRHVNTKDKERRLPPGKGVKHMRAVGIEMAERTRGYGQRLQLVLSV